MARRLLIATALLLLGIFLVAPFVAMLVEAFAKGVPAYVAAVLSPETRQAAALTALVVVIVVPLNTLFGVAAAWALGKFDFRGKALLMTLIDLPYTVSPVIAGLVFVLLFGRNGLFGVPFRVIFATPGVVLATLFVTFPMVARELVPLFQAQGRDEEEAAVTLGASGWQTFWRVTLPNVRWGVLYGVILCTGRALGEFGAVSVVSGHVRGETSTLPLHVEILYNEFNLAGAFAVASLLASLGLVTLVLKLALRKRRAA